jgi:hypothetical protein
MPNTVSLLDEHVVLNYECFDRLFFNGYLPRLQTPEQLAYFLTQVRGEEIPRYRVVGEMTAGYLRAVDAYATAHGVPVVQFEGGQRKEDVAAAYFAKAEQPGVVMIGVAQERARAFRPRGKRDREVGEYAVIRARVFVNHHYFYIWDADWGPSFVRRCSYAPWGLRIWLNGHQWAKRQLARRRIAFEPLDNGIAAVDRPGALRQICDRLGPAQVQGYCDRWLSRLPSPLTDQDRGAGYRYTISTLQCEVSRTQVFDRPLHGRQFFEQVIADQLDLGRPEKLQLVFHRRIPRRPGEGPWRTRVLTAEVDPSLQVRHRSTRVKQYWKCNRALRTETTINDARDFGVGKLLPNLPLLRDIGRGINDRLLELERRTQRCAPAASVFEDLVLPTGEAGSRAPGLRFGDPRVVALFAALCDFRWLCADLRNRALRPLVEQHLARPYGQRQMAYDLRRLVRKGIIARVPRTHRYELTDAGRLLILFCSRLYAHALCPGLGQLLAPPDQPSPLATAWRRFDDRVVDLLDAARAAA